VLFGVESGRGVSVPENELDTANRIAPTTQLARIVHLVSRSLDIGLASRKRGMVNVTRKSFDDRKGLQSALLIAGSLPVAKVVLRNSQPLSGAQKNARLSYLIR
jgi:hypothetical protein